MRPAQKAPENLGDEDGRSLGIGRFNEAGAKSAGKRHAPNIASSARGCFNEAGAKSAGKPG